MLPAAQPAPAGPSKPHARPAIPGCSAPRGSASPLSSRRTFLAAAAASSTRPRPRKSPNAAVMDAAVASRACDQPRPHAAAPAPSGAARAAPRSVPAVLRARRVKGRQSSAPGPRRSSEGAVFQLAPFLKRQGRRFAPTLSQAQHVPGCCHPPAAAFRAHSRYRGSPWDRALNFSSV